MAVKKEVRTQMVFGGFFEKNLLRSDIRITLLGRLKSSSVQGRDKGVLVSTVADPSWKAIFIVGNVLWILST